MFGLGIPEVLLIVLAFGILFFGSSKIVDLAKSMGRVSGEFKKSKKEVEQELRNAEADVASSEPKKDDA